MKRSGNKRKQTKPFDQKETRLAGQRVAKCLYEPPPLQVIRPSGGGSWVRQDHVPYDIWQTQGHLYTTQGNVIHYGFIEAFIEELGTRYNIQEIAFDRWGAVQMSQNLEGLGFTVVPFGQWFKDMSPPTKELMKLALKKYSECRRLERSCLR